MTRIAASDGGAVTATVIGASLTPTDLDALPVATVADIDGDPVGAALTVTKTATGVYRAVLPPTHAACDAPGLPTVTFTGALAGQPWTATVPVEVTGPWPFTLAELRAANSDLDDPVRYPDVVLAAARQAAVERVESVTKVSWTTRFARAVLDGGRDRLVLPHVAVTRLLAVDADGTAWDPDDCVVWPWGEVAGPERWPGRLRGITVDYLHGTDPCPNPVAEAAIDLAVAAAVEAGRRLPDRATSMTTDLGTFRLSLPGRDGPTGIPRVDSVLDEYGWRRPAVG